MSQNKNKNQNKNETSSRKRWVLMAIFLQFALILGSVGVYYWQEWSAVIEIKVVAKVFPHRSLHERNQVRLKCDFHHAPPSDEKPAVAANDAERPKHETQNLHLLNRRNYLSGKPIFAVLERGKDGKQWEFAYYSDKMPEKNQPESETLMICGRFMGKYRDSLQFGTERLSVTEEEFCRVKRDSKYLRAEVTLSISARGRARVKNYRLLDLRKEIEFAPTVLK
ncbi:MAG: hypothetical protein Q4C70_09005 [Planctomycetia bacterium]|nr:hypothetical protein [Planctomycetia bacterium]